MVFSVKQKNCKVEISRKGDPNQIGDLQNSRDGSDFIKFNYHDKDCCPESDKPNKRKKECSQIEENYAPEEVEKEADSINSQCFPDFIGFYVFFAVYHGCTDAHEYVK